jgi:hypothetical protein
MPLLIEIDCPHQPYQPHSHPHFGLRHPPPVARRPQLPLQLNAVRVHQAFSCWRNTGVEFLLPITSCDVDGWATSIKVGSTAIDCSEGALSTKRIS